MEETRILPLTIGKQDNKFYVNFYVSIATISKKRAKIFNFSVGNYPNKTQEPKVEWLKFSTIPNLPQEVPEMRETKPNNFRY